MPYLQRINHRPIAGNMTPEEQHHLLNHFDAYGAEMLVDGQVVPWYVIEEVEVVVAPHASGLAGWVVKTLLQGGRDRYHIGVYFGAREAVLPNVTWAQARYVLENIAFYAPQPIRYTGPEELIPLIDV